MKKNILKYSLFGCILLFGFFSWFSVYNIPKLSGLDAWILSIIFFSLYVISMCLAAILVRQEVAMEIVIFVSFFLSLIFAFSLWHFIVIMLSILLMLAALRNIRKDLDLNIKVDLWKSLYTGKFKMILALVLIISSQYFFMINGTNGQKFVPKLDFSSVTSRLIQPILVMLNPNFKSVQKDGLTVDQFIIQSQQKNTDDAVSNQSLMEEMVDQQIPKNLPAEQQTTLKQQALQQIADSKNQLSQKNNELVLQEGREQLSQMVGHNMDGDEKIADVFAGLIDKKLNDFFQPRISGDSQSSSYSYILTAILFLTIWPLALIMSLFWFTIVLVAFKLFICLGLVEITTVTVQREMIV